jgi:hypothetical protein
VNKAFISAFFDAVLLPSMKKQRLWEFFVVASKGGFQ